MRRAALTAALIMLAGCAAPPSDGGVWSRQGQQQELAISRLSNEQRAAAAHVFELRLADEALSAMQARLEDALPACPDARLRSSTVSVFDEVRDRVRVRIGDDPTRVARVQQLALADESLRLGQCDQARAALAGELSPAEPASAPPAVTVTRSPGYPGDITEGDPTQLLVEYALGWTDTVRAPAPVAQHLARVYGGALMP